MMFLVLDFDLLVYYIGGENFSGKDIVVEEQLVKVVEFE